MIPYERPDWHAHAACHGTDPDLFFGSRGNHSTAMSRHARAVCETCPVRWLCANYAIENLEKIGMWGGFSERQRRTIRSDRKRRIEIRSKAHVEAVGLGLRPPALWVDGKPTRVCGECRRSFSPSHAQHLYCDVCAVAHRRGAA